MDIHVLHTKKSKFEGLLKIVISYDGLLYDLLWRVLLGVLNKNYIYMVDMVTYLMRMPERFIYFIITELENLC